VLNHCANHGYDALADKAAIVTISLSNTIDKALGGLKDPGVAFKWVLRQCTPPITTYLTDNFPDEILWPLAANTKTCWGSMDPRRKFFFEVSTTRRFDKSISTSRNRQSFEWRRRCTDCGALLKFTPWL
jgi:hypothetical protein